MRRPKSNLQAANDFGSLFPNDADKKTKLIGSPCHVRFGPQLTQGVEFFHPNGHLVTPGLSR